MSIFHFTRRALRHWPSSLSTSVEIKSVLMSSTPLNIKLSTLNFISALTFLNNKKWVERFQVLQFHFGN